MGQLLTAAVGTIADPDGLPEPFLTDDNTSFQWVRVTSGTDDDISGETASTYTLATADEGKTIKVKVSFQDGGGGSEGPLTSVATAVVSAAANSLATGEPTITGTPTVGETLTAATTAIMDVNGLTTPGYTYQWIRVATDNTETNISSATASTYTLVTDDLGATIKVKVSFTDDASNAETLTSVATAVVSAADTVPGAPTGLSATASGTSQINLTWTAPGSTGGTAITGYKIEVSPDGLSTTWTDQVANTNDANTTYAHTGLQAGITRYYRVSAINATATGPVSNTDSATTASDGTVQNFLLNFGTNFSHTVVVRESRDVNHLLTLNLRYGPFDPPNGNPTRPVTIPLVVKHQGGATEADYEGLPATVTFGVGESVAAFNLRAIQDQIRETGEGLRIDFGELPRGVRKGEAGPYETVEFVDGLVPIRATVDGTTLVLTYNNVLNPASAPWPSDFTVRVAGQGVTVDAVGVSGALLTLTLATAVQAGRPVTVDYRQGANLIHDVDGTRASDFYDWVVTNNTGGGGGVELVPTRATVTGTMLELTYNKVLNSASMPSPSDFTATVAGNVVPVDAVRVGGSSVTLTLATAVEAGQTVTLDYRQGANLIHDVDGTRASDFYDWVVTNNTGGGGGVELVPLVSHIFRTTSDNWEPEGAGSDGVVNRSWSGRRSNMLSWSTCSIW